MNTNRIWKILVLSLIFSVTTGGVSFAGGDNDPNFQGRMNGVDIRIETLTTTDIHIGEDVDFQVTVMNSTDGWRRLWLWFTVRLEDTSHEKMLRDPYMDKGVPYHGTIPPQGEVILRFRGRPLDTAQVGFYTVFAKIGPEIIPFNQQWVSAMDSFNGNILPSEAPVHPLNDRRDGRWIIQPIETYPEFSRSLPVSEMNRVVKKSRVVENYPNPFNPSTSITYEVERADEGARPVELSVYDIRGRLVRKLVDGSNVAGQHTVEWDGRDDRGLPVDSGIYLFQLRSGLDISLKKGILTR